MNFLKSQMVKNKPPPVPVSSSNVPISIEKRRKSDNLVLIQSIKNDLKRILAKRNSLSLTDLNDNDDDYMYNCYDDVENALIQKEKRMDNLIVNGVRVKKTARSLSAIPPFNSEKFNLRRSINSSKWLKKIGSKATMAIKKSIENLIFG